MKSMLASLLCISFIKVSHELDCPKASFPLTIGGSNDGDTYIYQISYHAGSDKLVVAGVTDDADFKNPQNTVFSVPIIALYKS